MQLPQFSSSFFADQFSQLRLMQCIVMAFYVLFPFYNLATYQALRFTINIFCEEIIIQTRRHFLLCKNEQNIWKQKIRQNRSNACFVRCRYQSFLLLSILLVCYKYNDTCNQFLWLVIGACRHCFKGKKTRKNTK